LRGPVETPGAKLGRLAVPLLFDEGPILGHIIERLEDRLERNLIVPSEFFGSTRIRTVDGLVDHCRPDPPPLEE
jgi:hypothetical protein